MDDRFFEVDRCTYAPGAPQSAFHNAFPGDIADLSGVFPGTGYHTILMRPRFRAHFSPSGKSRWPEDDLSTFASERFPPLVPFDVIAYLNANSSKISIKYRNVLWARTYALFDFSDSGSDFFIVAHDFSLAVNDIGRIVHFTSFQRIDRTNHVTAVL